MAASEALSLVALSLSDVAGGLALSDAAGWNQSADDWSFFIAAGAAFGVRDERERFRTLHRGPRTWSAC